MSASKRRRNAIRTPAEAYKSAKANSHCGGGVNDVGEGAGGALPEGVSGDDDEGRFFGSGVTQLEEQILDFVDGQDDGAVTSEPIDETWLKKASLALDRCIGKNAELRAAFPHEPQRFISSEVNMNMLVKEFSVLTEYPQLYAAFVHLGCPLTLAGLLSHENTDISIDVVELFAELTSEDVTVDKNRWNILVDALLDADLVDMLVSNLARLREEYEPDRNGICHILNMLENLCSRHSVAEQLGQHQPLLQWLLNRSKQGESPVSQNKQYSTEVLAILSQASTQNRQQLIDLNAIDDFLQLVAAYRMADPERTSEEEEYMQDLFDILTCLVDEPEGKAKFLQAEGIELCLIMLREGHMSKQPALKLLDHALGGSFGGKVCQTFVGLGGLKPVFTLFIKKSDHRYLQRLLEIFSSLLRSVPSECPERVRVLAKFIENNYEKTVRLIQLRRDYAAMTTVENKRIAEEKKTSGDLTSEEIAANETEYLVRRLEAGLLMQQTIDLILAWLAAEDVGAKGIIGETLASNGESMLDVKQSLTSQLNDAEGDGPDDHEKRDMLTVLIECLE